MSITGTKAKIKSTGNVTIAAFQIGDKCFTPANAVNRTFKVTGQTTQVITFDPIDPVSFGEAATLPEMTSQGLKIRYTLSDTSMAVIVDGNKLFALKSGSVIVTADQDGIADSIAPARQMWQTVKLYVPTFVIIGKTLTEEFSQEKYRISPKLNGLNYEWSYSINDTTSFFTTGRNNNSADVLFSDKSPNDTLRCKVYQVYNTNKSAPILVKMPITISHPNENQLIKINCDSVNKKQNTCTGNFIDGFIFGEINHSNTGCSAPGYMDYSKSPYSSKLFLGENYNADIAIGSYTGNKNNNYVGIWIDYNNNGSFNDPSEFLLSAHNANSSFQLNNILISANSVYLGEHQMRVRTRNSGLFAFNESCIDYNETGETEDYKVTLVANDRLEAPVLLTPNDDGKNDFFVLKGIDSKQNSKLTILDRSGNVLYVEENYTNTWGGKDNNGKILPRDTYYYVFVNGDNTVRGFFEVRY